MNAFVSKMTILNMKIPIAGSVTIYEAIGLFKGTRTIASRGRHAVNWKVHQFVLYCFCGILAGIVGGFLGLGGGFILGPLFLELGVPPQVLLFPILVFLKCIYGIWNSMFVLQVASATSTFAMTFSSSMSVIQYYLLDRFPVPYGKPKKEKQAC